MAHFGLENEMSNVTRMDLPLTRVAPMRFQRATVLSARSDSTAMNGSKNDSMLNMSGMAGMQGSSKTPNKILHSVQPLSLNMSLGMNKSFGRNTPGRHSKTPNKNITPGRMENCGDRFIPNRAATQFELGHYLVTSSSGAVVSGDSGDEAPLSTTKRQYQKVISENLNNGNDIANSKIIAYQQKPPQHTDGLGGGNMKVLYSQSKTTSSVSKPTRHIPQAPERILDAPEILDDYYLNLIDWSVQNQLAVCLGPGVYLWNAATGEIVELAEAQGEDEYISSVNWDASGANIAIGLSNGDVQLWDVEKSKKLRTMSGHAARVGCMSWNNYVLSSGSRSGRIHHHDVRVANHLVGGVNAHTQEVCGLKWSPDGRYLASGGNDNILNVWPVDPGHFAASSNAVHTFNQHLAAVKALAWCPWQPSLLASGGGTADRHIRFWNCSAGNCVASVDTNSQVCALLWSKEYKELVSSHGFAHNQLIIWRYPSLTKVAELTGHTSRVLHMALSPDGTTVASAAADETLRLWNCFAVDPHKKVKQVESAKSASDIVRRQNIR